MAKKWIKITSEPQWRKGKKEWTYRYKIPAIGDKAAYWGKTQKTGTTSKKEAKRIAEEYRQELEERINAWEIWEKITLGEYAERWHEQRRGEIAESTYIKENQQIGQIIESEIGQIPIDEIEPEDIEAQKKKNAAKGWSKDKQRRYIQKVKHITSEAAKKRTIRYDPGAVVKDIKAKSKRRKSPTAFEIGRIENLLQADKKTGYTTALYIALHTGMRRGEILGLQWQDINFINGYIKIERQYTAQKNIKAPKWDSSGVIPMTETLKEWLKEWQRILWEKISGDTAGKYYKPVCAGINGQYIDPNNFGRWLRKYFTKAGLGKINDSGHYHGYTLHDIRHHIATQLLGTGADLESVRTIMRHKSIITTQGYLHEINENLKKAMNTLAEDKTKNAEEAAMIEAIREGKVYFEQIKSSSEGTPYLFEVKEDQKESTD